MVLIMARRVLQAGRYMKDFRRYSDKYSFRQRSETPSMAVELSLQPWRSFGTDAVIMFSDILTPLPAMGVDFQIVAGAEPVVPASVVDISLYRLETSNVGLFKYSVQARAPSLLTPSAQLATLTVSRPWKTLTRKCPSSAPYCR